MVRIREIKSLFHLFVARCMKTVAYLRISTGSQDLANQKLAVLDYARQKRFAIDRFVEAQASSRKGRDQRRIEDLLGTLAAGDRLVVSELSRLGRSLGQVIQIVDELVKRKVRFVGDQGSDPLRGEAGPADQGDDRPVRAVRRGREGPDLGTDQGGAGGRPGQGPLARPPQGLAGHVQARRQGGGDPDAPGEEVSKASIAKIVGVSPTNLRHFIRTRKLAPEVSRHRERSRRP